FEDKFKEYAKFNSKEEEIVAKKFVQMMEGVCNSEMKKFDANTVVMLPMEIQLLFQKVHWKLANRLWNVAYVAPSAYGEQMSIARNVVEQTAMLQHAFLDLVFQLGLNKTENFINKLFDGYRLSLLATGEAQKVREQLVGAFSKPDTLEIYSETTRQKMAENKKLKEANFRMTRFSGYRSNQMKRGFMNQNKQVSNQQRQRGIVKGGLKGFRFGRKWKDNNNNNKMEKNSEEADDKEDRI
ncbi:MAG: hypothetical protein EZS28_043421, partial [Streblomastix strix]